MILVPASFNERVTNQTVLIGNRAVIVCDALGDNPIKIRWLINHRFIDRTPKRMKVRKFFIRPLFISYILFLENRRQIAITIYISS